MKENAANDIYRRLRVRLQNAGIEDAGLAARIILRQAGGVSDADLIAGAPVTLSPETVSYIESAAARHIAGEPLSRIFGEKEFHGLMFEVTPAVLDPRPDTETLVDAALRRLAGVPSPYILDLGTGSGCIIVSLLHALPRARGVAVDVSPAALEVAKRNAERHGAAPRLELLEGAWFAPVAGTFDLIVSNPPYIPSQEIESLDASVKNHDPILALDGGMNGLEAYKKIFTEMKKFLVPGGAGLFEIGIGQGPDIARLAAEAGLSVNESYIDLGGVERVLEIAAGEN
jgi:release factor glutamine methyltransferase